MARRYRKNFELTSPTPAALTTERSISGLTVLGLVANPKTKEPALVVTDGEYVSIRSLSEGEILKRLGRGYYETHSNDPANATSLPRVHTPDGVLVKGAGWGTSLYTALCLGAYQVKASGVDIEMYERGEGICSWTDDRSPAADGWWQAARKKGLTEIEEQTETEREENVELEPSATELNRCLTVDEGDIVYVNRVDVDIEKTIEKEFDYYKYTNAWNHDLVICELSIKVTANDLAFVWKTLMHDPSEIQDVNKDALLALDVRRLDPDARESSQRRLFTPNGIPDVAEARARTAWADLANLP